MSGRNYFIGLGEYATYRLAKEVSDKVPNSRFFSINDWSSNSAQNSYGIAGNGLALEDYYNMLLPESRIWNRICPVFLDRKFNITYYSRSDVRMIYEYRYKYLHSNEKDDEIFVKELSQVSDGDAVHILIPSSDGFADSVSFFIGWDLKSFFNKICKNVSVIAHFILPDTNIYGVRSKALYYSYARSCAFIKELICIVEICNGTFKNNINFDISDFELSCWFNGTDDYGNIEKLPFDGISFVGYKEEFDSENYQYICKILNSLPNEIIECISDRKESILSCRSNNFMIDLYKKCPMYSSGGRAFEAYKKYQLERGEFSDSLHLDWRWDKLMNEL